MSIDSSDLTCELDAWAESGAVATFWWRDDDAVAVTAQLDTLLSFADAVPITLAVIPGALSATLAPRLRPLANVTVFQHGWLHANHAIGGLSEYPGPRAVEEVERELDEGAQVLASAFGDQFLPVFAPPWHGFDECFLPSLAAVGLRGISRKGMRAAERLGGLYQANAHVAPIRWTTPPTFDDEPGSIAAIVAHLRERRLGSCDSSEPTGILTHHLVQPPRSFEFLELLARRILDHPAARWVGAREIFAPAVPS
jgi:hypothetical protein